MPTTFVHFVTLAPVLVVALIGCVAAVRAPRQRRPLMLAGALVVTLSVFLRGIWLILVPDLHMVLGPEHWLSLFSLAQPLVFGVGVLLLAVGVLRGDTDTSAPAVSWHPERAAPTYSLPPDPGHSAGGAYGPGGAR